VSGSHKILLAIGTTALLGLAAIVLSQSDDDPMADDGLGGLTEPVDDVDPKILIPFQAEPPPRSAKPVIDPASNRGMISGRIVVSTKVIGKISSYVIVVQEDFNTNGRKEGDPLPFFKKKTYPAKFSAGVPFFDIEDIPFSRHPYRVSVIARGVNGSSATTYITAESPLGSDGDVELSLTPGSYYSIRLRDQRQVARPNLPVRMIPVGDSLVARETQIGKSDRSGCVLFEDVVKGDYEIRVGPETAPLAPPMKVQIHAAFASFSQGRPTVQGTVVLVPDGHHVTIEIISRWGYGVENAALKAWQLEVQRYYEFKGKTDRAGRFQFENVPFGIYQLSVQSPHNGMRDLKFKVEKDKDAPIVKVTMPR